MAKLEGVAVLGIKASEAISCYEVGVLETALMPSQFVIEFYNQEMHKVCDKEL